MIVTSQINFILFVNFYGMQLYHDFFFILKGNFYITQVNLFIQQYTLYDRGHLSIIFYKPCTFGTLFSFQVFFLPSP